MPEFDHTRVGDADRTDALDRLGSQFADGYLDIREFEERTARAAVAKTRGELSALFDDLPDEPHSPNAPEAPALPAVTADSELAEKLTAKRKMDTAQVITGVLGAAAFFTLQFGFDLDNAWMVWPVMGLVMVMWYTVFDISDEEEDVLEEIQEKERKERAERLKIAYERRKELGK